MKKLSQSEFQGVLSADGTRRYRHFVSRAADRREIWGLRHPDGWVSMGNSGQHYVPVWPAPEYAQACALDEFAGAQPTSIDLDAWLEVWLPNLARDGAGVAVFPTPAGQGVVVEPSALAAHLRAELARLE